MKLSQSSLALLEDTLKKAIGKYTCGCEQTIVTDIHLQPNQNSGELSIFDDEDEELANTSIEEWMTTSILRVSRSFIRKRAVVLIILK